MYDALAAFYDRLDDGADKSRWAAWLGELIRRRVGCGEGADLGCGTGAFTRLLQREVTLCCACDRSPAMLNEAAKALRLPLVQADFASFRAPHRLDFLTVVNDGLNYVSFERLPGTLTHLCGQLRAVGALLGDQLLVAIIFHPGSGGLSVPHNVKVARLGSIEHALQVDLLLHGLHGEKELGTVRVPLQPLLDVGHQREEVLQEDEEAEGQLKGFDAVAVAGQDAVDRVEHVVVVIGVEIDFGQFEQHVLAVALGEGALAVLHGGVKLPPAMALLGQAEIKLGILAEGDNLVFSHAASSWRKYGRDPSP